MAKYLSLKYINKHIKTFEINKYITFRSIILPVKNILVTILHVCADIKCHSNVWRSEASSTESGLSFHS